MADPDDIVLVYDKQCPVCDFYCEHVSVEESAGRLVRIDARDPSDIMAEITTRGLDIDEGMVLKAGGQLYYGADAIHELARLSSRKGFFNRLAHWTFRSKPVARVLYPIMKFGRNLLLKMLGRTRINNLGKSGNERF